MFIRKARWIKLELMTEKDAQSKGMTRRLIEPLHEGTIVKGWVGVVGGWLRKRGGGEE